jgi:hypothetical protein
MIASAAASQQRAKKGRQAPYQGEKADTDHHTSSKSLRLSYEQLVIKTRKNICMELM